MPLGIVSDDVFSDQLKERTKSNIILPRDDRDKTPEIVEGEIVDEIPNEPVKKPLDFLAQIIQQKIGRGNKVETPSSLRQIIAEESINGAPSKDIQSAFDVSQSSISAYKHGATSTATYNKPDKELKPAVNKVRARIIRKAEGKLISALAEITPDKLKEAKLKDLSAIARDMSSVIKNMEPEKEDQSDGPKVAFVFMRPPMKDESDFDQKQIMDNQ